VTESKVPNPPHLRKLPIAVVAAVVAIVIAVAYVLVLDSFHADEVKQSKPLIAGNSSQTGDITSQAYKGTEALIDAEIVSIDDGKQQMTVRLKFPVNIPTLVDDLQLLKQPVFLIVNGAEGGQLIAFKAGDLLQPTDVTVSLSGQVRDYPFDHYNANVSIYFTQYGTTASPPQALDTIVRLKGAVQGYSVSLDRSVPSKKDPVRSFIVRFRRAPATRFFAIFIIVLMWALALAGAAIALVLTYVRHDIGPGVLGFLAALLFALPNIRGALPGAPPIGSLNDYLAFFWAEAIVAITLIVLAVIFLIRELRSRAVTSSQTADK
jgi:hypothetical protein